MQLIIRVILLSEVQIRTTSFNHEGYYFYYRKTTKIVDMILLPHSFT